MNDREPSAAIDDAAARWIAARDAAPDDPMLAVAIANWAEADPRRRGALLRAEAAWIAMAGAPLAKSVASPTRRRVLAAGIAASVAAAGAGGWALFGREARYATGIGERRRVRLADGSTMVLNTHTRSAVTLGERRRRVTLTEGEAWFKVAHDPSRPFIVAVDDIRVEAVGTAFAVRRDGNRADVIVTEGRVRAWSEADPARFLMIAAGQRATLARGVVVDTADLVTSGIDEALAWRQGEIVLDGMTLGDAAAAFNRYNTRHLAVEAPLANRRMVGRFRTGDIEGFARAAAAVSGGRIESGEGEIRIVE